MSVPIAQDSGYQPMRVFFKKEGRAVYCSHLDLIRTITRAMARAKIPAWYTQGFHPHLYMTFSLPLSLGVASCCESFDFRLVGSMAPEEMMLCLNRTLPQGLLVLKAADPIFSPKDIMWADYRINLFCSTAQLTQALECLKEKSEISVEKRGKKGVKTIDIKSMFSVIAVTETSQGAGFNLRCRAGIEINLNPALVLQTLYETNLLPASQSEISRTKILTELLEEYR